MKDNASENPLIHPPSGRKRSARPLGRAEILQRLEALKTRRGDSAESFERIALSRHTGRPRTIDFIKNLFEDFVELSGDRSSGDDPAVIGGFARMGSMRFMVIGQEKGKDTQSRIERNFGMVHPEGFRKALRLAQLAEKFSLPLVLVVDTPGAHPGAAAEERGQGWAIAFNLRELFRIKTPILVVILSEGCSGGALGMGVGDAIGMAEHAYFSVISPESCASILWRNPSKAREASSALKLHAEDMLTFEIIDEIIEEGKGAHLDPALFYANTRDFILQQLAHLQTLTMDELLERRYQKFRKMGSHEPESYLPSASQ